MTFEEILPLFKKGKSYMRKETLCTYSLVKLGDTMRIKIWTDPSNENSYRLTADDVLADDWEEA